MNRILKRILLGLIIWAVPFVTSIFVWDMEANAAKISMAWFSALMVFAWAVGFAIAACLYFRDIVGNAVKEGWITGITWYIEMLMLDLVVLVFLFSMPIKDLYSQLLTYLNVIAICASIGYILRR